MNLAKNNMLYVFFFPKHENSEWIVVVQSLSRVWLFATPWTAAHQASLSFTISQSLLKLLCIKSVMPSNHLNLCCSLLLLPLIFLSIRGFSNESACRIRWPKYWRFNFSISPSSEYSGLISFRIDLRENMELRDFPGSPVVKTPRFHCRDQGFNP